MYITLPIGREYMNRVFRLISMTVLTAAVCFTTAWGEPVPTASPEDAGLSSARLERINRVVDEYIQDGKIAGAVTLVARHGKVAHFEAHGWLDRENKIPMRTDAMFRICSMSKPITCTAMMILYEEGKFLMDDPVSKYIPEFADIKVLPESKSLDPNDWLPAERPVTIRHLMTHTSGITYNWNGDIGSLYDEAGIGHGMLQEEDTILEDMKKLAKIPLLFQPGTQFHYGLNNDVLGALVEVLSGMTFDEFLKERVFRPLGIEDICFFVPDGKVPRLATAYTYYTDRGLERFPDEPIVEGPFAYSADYPYNGPKRFYSGGAGMVATAGDYWRFCQMALNGGEFNGARILSPVTVDFMTTDHVGDKKSGYGYGLGYGVVTEDDDQRELVSVGRFDWGGFFYTTFYIDPKKDMIAIMMAQLHPAQGVDLSGKFRVLSYQAVVE